MSETTEYQRALLPQDVRGTITSISPHSVGRFNREWLAVEFEYDNHAHGTVCIPLPLAERLRVGDELEFTAVRYGGFPFRCTHEVIVRISESVV